MCYVTRVSSLVEFLRARNLRFFDIVNAISAQFRIFARKAQMELRKFPHFRESNGNGIARNSA